MVVSAGMVVVGDTCVPVVVATAVVVAAAGTVVAAPAVVVAVAACAAVVTTLATVVTELEGWEVETRLDVVVSAGDSVIVVGARRGLVVAVVAVVVATATRPADATPRGGWGRKAATKKVPRASRASP